MTLIDISAEETGPFNFSTCSNQSIVFVDDNVVFFCFLPLNRTDIETKKTLETLAGYIQAPPREETVSVAFVTQRVLLTF